MRILARHTSTTAQESTSVLVLVAASRLAEVADFVKEANRLRRLRALLVHADLDETWIGQMLHRAELRTLRKLLVHRGEAQPRRIVNAWRLGAQHDLIADALALPESLLVLGCAMERLEVPWGDIGALQGVGSAERNRFVVSSDGSYIHWPGPDVHLNLESLQMEVDPGARDEARLERLRQARGLGAAVAALRAIKGLRQVDMEGVTARQVRRIEAGEVFPRLSTLAKLAAAHRMTRADYLDSLAIEQSRTTWASSTRRRP